MMSVRCRRCEATLTPLLKPVEGAFEPEVTDCENLIPRGSYWIAHDFLPEHVNSHIVVHLEDIFDLRPHPDPKRHSGCCGEDGCDGPNRICECSAALATVVSDCWTGYYAHFEPDLVTLNPKQNKTGEQAGSSNGG
jgi:hypothetical protein